ncbi:MAG TPA: HAD family phosphatase [Geobacteraceae bacterium]|nr:HAD family phosphatase [Geobacteraceae bacterium]
MMRALIFDFDGIIVDTEPIHYRAFQEVLEPLGLGYSWEEYVSGYMGYDDREAFREAFKARSKSIRNDELGRLITQKASVFLKIIEGGIKAYPGVVKLIHDTAGNMPLALCSGALVSDITPILDQLGIRDKFDVVVTADDVAASKPDPASYILAVHRLSAAYPDSSIKPQNCLAIEDTPAGIESAKGAGIAVLAVTNSYPAERLKGADHIVDSMEKLTLRDLCNLRGEGGQKCA